MKKTVKLGAAAIILSAVTQLSYAAHPGFYAGAGLGKSKLETGNINLFENLEGMKSSTSRHIGGLGGRIFTGYNFSQYIGVEGGYARYAHSKYNGNAIAFGDTASASINYTLYALDLVGKGYLPLGGTGINLYGLGGVAYVSNNADANASFNNAKLFKSSPTTGKFRPKYGVGVSYDVPSTALTTSLEYSRIQGRGDVKTSLRAIPAADMTTFNVSYNFG